MAAFKTGNDRADGAAAPPQSEAELKKKRYRNQTLIIAPIVAMYFVLVLLLVTVFIPRFKQNKAMKMLDAGEYRAAYALLDELGRKEAVAPEMYDRAMAAIREGDYEAAYGMLGGLNYNDSARIAKECLFKVQKARLGEAEKGSTVFFGAYEQDNNFSNGAEEIEWIVLDRDGSRALLISKYGLDAREFHDEENIYFESTWAGSQLRPWLNKSFYPAAFSAGQQEMILTTEVTADKNPDFDTKPGRETKDKIFLLSVNEAEEYFESDSARQCIGSEYCYARGALTGEDGACWWWLRTPGAESISTTVVTARGSVFTNGFSTAHKPDLAVRPAMWIDLAAG